MNARKIWAELFQKPAGRLVLFLLVGGIFLTFILTRRGPQPKPDNTPVASQATRAKSYSFEEDIQPLSRTEATPSPRESDRVARPTPTPKPPPAIPQTIFATLCSTTPPIRRILIPGRNRTAPRACAGSS